MTSGMKSSEFWLTLIFMIGWPIFTTFFPDAPTEQFYAAFVYIAGRLGVKITQEWKKPAA